MARKLAITLDRIRALQSAVDLLAEREKRTRLARELAKLDRRQEQRVAEEGLGVCGESPV